MRKRLGNLKINLGDEKFTGNDRVWVIAVTSYHRVDCISTSWNLVLVNLLTTKIG